jgi:ergothioneine biosynthesis protein EgtB
MRTTVRASRLGERFREIRSQSERLCAPLAVEDYVVQSMPDVSPPKWHLAHTTWFWETFLLQPNVPDYRPFHPRYNYLFNSYYEAVGKRHPRPERGLLSRPTVDEIYRYRAYVDDEMDRLLAAGSLGAEAEALVELGLHHEQQHQELLLTDLKYNLGINPLRPAYRSLPIPPERAAPALEWLDFEGGMEPLGVEGEGFYFDNEGPRHETWVRPFRLASRPVTCGEYLEFMADGSYSNARYWLSDGWRTVNERGWEAPLYWEQADGEWWIFTLSGMRPVDPNEPVTHISFYEADAYARWAGRRLPLESEWETAARDLPLKGNFVDADLLHPAPATGVGLQQMFGDVWEWTASPYVPYPGYRSAEGPVGEYNGKFMCNQLVLRGGSCATPASHIRPSYRNFFPPEARWQFTGVRLADD